MIFFSSTLILGRKESCVITTKHDFPEGTLEWVGDYIIRYDAEEKVIIESGHAVRLPKGGVQLFDAKRETVVPIPGRSFSIIISKRDQVFCSFVPVVENVPVIEKTLRRKKIRAG